MSSGGRLAVLDVGMPATEGALRSETVPFPSGVVLHAYTT